MPFECLVNVTAAKRKTPALGIRMGNRAAARGSRFIYMYIGHVLAADMSFRNQEHRCDVLVGTGTEKGQLAVNVHDQKGMFVAKRQKDGSYKVTIKEGAADGRLNTNFEEFTVEEATKVAAQGGAPKMFMFRTAKDVLCG